MTKPTHTKFAAISLIIAGMVFTAAPGSIAAAQTSTQKPLAAPDAPPATPRRTRLILKDGSYQIVMSYRVAGKLVRYVSAERGGAEEEIPLELVDLEATRRYEA